MKRILFIGHEATRSGAPFVLLHLINWLKAHCSQHEIDILLLRGGDLENAYRKAANVFVLPNEETTSLFRRGIVHLKMNGES